MSGYNPNRLAQPVYIESVVERMNHLGFDLIANIVISSDDSPYRWNYVNFARYTNLVFKHRKLALVILASHRETAGTNANNGSTDGKTDGVNVNHYHSYWHVNVLVRWNNPENAIWDNRDSMFGKFVTHHSCGGNYSAQQANISLEAFAKTKDGEFLWDQRISAYDLCQPILQLIANMRGKMASGKVAEIWSHDLIPGEFDVNIYFAMLIQNGAMTRIEAIAERIPGLPKQVA